MHSVCDCSVLEPSDIIFVGLEQYRNAEFTFHKIVRHCYMKLKNLYSIQQA